jgi:uncharacterized protein YecE (DUF72 family)
MHPQVLVGTASDRYTGWIGQVYSEERYRGRWSTRSTRVGKTSFKVETLPIDSVEEYFSHFSALEIDYTFYAPLLEENGAETHALKLLRQHCRHMGDGDELILKVPQLVFAQKLKRGAGFVENESFLNPEIFLRQFYFPAIETLGHKLAGFIFEQEYQLKKERWHPEKVASVLDKFFGAVPADTRYQIELRTEDYLSEPVFSVLQKYGVGQVLSHWTWLPSLEHQFRRAGRRFFSSGKRCLIRLMTPRQVKYEDAYATAFPFDRLIDDMLQPDMIRDTVNLLHEGISQGMRMVVVINNRSGGNAPLIAQLIAKSFNSS